VITASKLVSVGFLSIGIVVLMQVILPVASFQVWDFGQKLNNKNLISPIRSKEQILGVSVQNKDNFPVLVSDVRRLTTPDYSEFQITIPRLKMEEATVYVDNNDLSKGLIQLPGSALPGEKGNLFISGHSAISHFLTGQRVPFVKLFDLKKGDEILVKAGGAKFLYKVVETKVVDPSDLSVIPAPDERGRYISLMTCVPPGLNFKRLVVLGKML